MGEKQMPDGNRLREQVDEMTMRAEVSAAVATDHQKIATERQDLANRELQKLRLLVEVFAMGEKVLRQKQKNLLESGETPTELALGGLEDAITNVVGLAQQAQRHISHNEGAVAALQAMEETFRQKAQQATSRARGMDVVGKRAIGVAESRNLPQTAQGGSQSPEQTPLASSAQGVSSVSGFLDTALGSNGAD
jgi:hypothetical protein